MLPQFAYSKNNIVLQFKLTYVIIVLACNIFLTCFMLCYLLQLQVLFKINSNFCILPEQWLYIVLLILNSQ